MCGLESNAYTPRKVFRKSSTHPKGWIHSTNTTNQRGPYFGRMVGFPMAFHHSFHREMSHKKKYKQKNSIQQKSVSKLYPVPNHLFWVSTILKVDFPWFKLKTQVVNRCLKLFHLILFPPSTFCRRREAKKLSHEMLGWHKDEVHKRKDF